MCHSNDNITSKPIFMEAIDINQNKRLERGFQSDLVFFYGDIDVNKPDDIKIIRDTNIIEKEGKGMLYSNFNYEAGSFALVDRHNGVEMEKAVEWAPCSDPLEWFKYNHCLLGKPKYVVVYESNSYTKGYGLGKSLFG